MSDTGATELRIFCICGQKMRVVESMYGRRGKCIACRQRIRIPERSELPADEKEIHLCEHPEFLRKAPGTRALTEPPAKPPRDEVPLGDATPLIVPLEPLEALQLLCSFDEEITRQFEALGKQDGKDAGPVGEVTLEGYRVLIENIRNDLDEQLRTHLGKVSAKLEEIEEQIAKANLNARAGEMDYADFARIIFTLRQRREFLALRRHNLRGWLATTDANLSGGRIAVKFEDIPCERIGLTLPPAPIDGLPLAERYVESLREAMTAREEAERKLVAWKRMEEEEPLPAGALGKSLDTHRAARARARAAVALYRQRMNQVIKDCDNDIKAVKGSLDTLRARFQSGALDKAVYQARETGLMRNQWDLAKARDLARAALRAERSAALPAARSSFIRRLAKQERGDGLGKDCWFAWLAAALMLLNITIDITPGQLTANMVALQGLTLVLFVTAVLVSMAAAIPRKRIRGGTYLVLALVYLIAVTACLEQTYHGLGPLGGALRSAPSWFLSAGVLLLFGNYVLVQAAAFVTLRKEEGPVRRALGWSPAIGLAAAAVAGSSCLGLYAPRPELLMPEPGLYSRAIAGYSVTFTIENRGHRPFWYGGSVAQLPRPVNLVIEKEQVPGNWRPISASHTMRHARWSGFRPPEPGHAVGRHRFVKLRYTLRPGEYRYRLNDPLGRGGDPFERLTLPAGMEMEGSWNAAQENTQDAEKAPAPETVTVKLRGVTDPKARSPLTYFLVTRPGGEPKEVKLRLGETIAGRWTISEYNTERASVTLSDGASFLLIRTGETLELTLPPPTPGADENGAEDTGE